MNQESGYLIHKIFSEVAQNNPEKIAFQIKMDSDWLRFTYKQTEELSKKIGGFLIKQGLKRGDFVALILENRPEWAMIYFGVLCSGSTCVPLNPESSPEELERLMDDCSPLVMFTSYKVLVSKISPRVKRGLKKIVVLELKDEGDNLMDFSRIKFTAIDDIRWPEVSTRDIASLIYTSGTTAQPKGVLLSHYNLCSNFKGVEELNLCHPSDNFLSILPLYHTYSFMVTLLMPLFLSATITYCASLKTEDIIQIIRETGVSILVGVPQLFSLIHTAIFKKLDKAPFFLKPLVSRFIRLKLRRAFGNNFRLMVCGGARLEPKLGYDLSRVCDFIEGYGLTETSPIVSLNQVRRGKLGSVGRAIPGVELKIFNPDASGVGEVLIKGTNVMQGYFKQPELTQKTIKDGWLHSGDLGYLDKHGFLFLTGREKDVIVLSSGKNIYPEELEEYYLRSPYIKEICILDRKQEKFGRLVDSLYAVVVADLEYFRKRSEVNITERIRNELSISAKDLPSHKHIMGFAVTREPLPRTPLKKIIRYKVKQRYSKEKITVEELKKLAVSSEDMKILETDVGRRIIKYLTRELKLPIYLDSHLELDLGIDSLSRVELVLGLEEMFEIKIPDEVIYNISTPRELIKTIQDFVSGGPPTVTELPEAKKQWSQILNRTPHTSVLNKIRVSGGFLERSLTFVFKYIFLFIFRIFWFLKIQGRENVPSGSPYIICSNHASYLDGFAIFSSLPFPSAADVFFIGHAKIFEHPFIAWAVKVARLISIDPSVHLIEAMQAASFVLKNKKIICIFPEGGRSFSEEVGEFKKGVGILLKELNIPVIPVHIVGSHYSWPVSSRFPKPYPLKIIFGKPMDWQQLGEDYQGIAKGLREKIIELGRS